MASVSFDEWLTELTDRVAEKLPKDQPEKSNAALVFPDVSKMGNEEIITHLQHIFHNIVIKRRRPAFIADALAYGFAWCDDEPNEQKWNDAYILFKSMRNGK